MKGKPQKIDLMELYAKSGTKIWNHFLSVCLTKKDLATLEKVLYGIQLGMEDLAKKNLNTNELILWFLKIQKSLEDTIKKVVRLKRPHPLDNPSNKSEWLKEIQSKRDRDMELERHLRKIRY